MIEERKDKSMFNFLKKALWQFLCDSISGRGLNPERGNYRKKLTTREEKIIYKAKVSMPKLQKVLDLAINSVRQESPELLEPGYVKQHFSNCVITLENKAFSIYLKHEQTLFLSIIDEWVSQNKVLLQEIKNRSQNIADFTKEVCKFFYPLVQRMEFESSQTRKARGGKSFERIIEYLLKTINIPCERPSGEARKILKRVDLVIPNQNMAINRPDRAYFLSCKRTLRERWKQAIPERKPSWRVFLLTIDENLPEDKAKEIDVLGMIVYVRDELKDRPYLQKKGWVRKLSSLPEDIIGGSI